MCCYVLSHYISASLGLRNLRRSAATTFGGRALTDATTRFIAYGNFGR